MKKTTAFLWTLSLLLHLNMLVAEEISPYKYNDEEMLAGLSYDIPKSARFTVKRPAVDVPDIIYYYSPPKEHSDFPIAIVCGGSSDKNSISSIIHLHRYFLKEFSDLGIAVVTVEQWGVDGTNIDVESFMHNYTRSQRLHDHQTVISHLKSHAPSHWNGKLVFLGVSEGGLLVTSLTQLYPNMTIATLNCCGASDWPWREELWVFIKKLRENRPWWMNLWDHVPFLSGIPITREEYDARMDEVLAKKSVDKDFLGMTYKYHADALLYPAPNYHKLRTPLLVVAGSEDPSIDSMDLFVHKAQVAGANITYLRVDGMDHYIRRRPEAIEKSFEWLHGTVKVVESQKIVSEGGVKTALSNKP